MAEPDNLRRRRLERLHEEFLNASECWPRRYHVAITVVPDETGVRTPEEARAVMRLYTRAGRFDDVEHIREFAVNEMGEYELPPEHRDFKYWLYRMGIRWNRALLETRHWNRCSRISLDRWHNYPSPIAIEQNEWLGLFVDPGVSTSREDDGLSQFFALSERISEDTSSDFSPVQTWLSKLYSFFPQSPEVAAYPKEKVLVIGLPWDVYLTSAKAIELLIEGDPVARDERFDDHLVELPSQDQPVVDNTNPGKPRIIVDLAQSKVTLDGVCHTITGEGARFLHELLKAKGNWVSSTDIDIRKPDRLKKAMPVAVSSLIESLPGKGSRIPREKLRPN